MARQQVHARLTPEAIRGWDRLVTRRRITFTTLLEAMGEALDRGEVSWVPEALIDRAHELDRERRSRR